MIRRLAISALICGVMAGSGAAKPLIQDIGVVRLTGDVWAGGARKSIEGRAMVCGLADADASLPVHAAPKASAEVVRNLLGLAIVELTGNVSATKDWAEMTGFVREVSPSGQTLPASKQKTVAVTGWVETRHLCTYFY